LSHGVGQRGPEFTFHGRSPWQHSLPSDTRRNLDSLTTTTLRPPLHNVAKHRGSAFGSVAPSLGRDSRGVGGGACLLAFADQLGPSECPSAGQLGSAWHP